jgi:hypothetical protein
VNSGSRIPSLVILFIPISFNAASQSSPVAVASAAATIGRVAKRKNSTSLLIRAAMAHSS